MVIHDEDKKIDESFLSQVISISQLGDCSFSTHLSYLCNSATFENKSKYNTLVRNLQWLPIALIISPNSSAGLPMPWVAWSGHVFSLHSSLGLPTSQSRLISVPWRWHGVSWAVVNGIPFDLDIFRPIFRPSNLCGHTEKLFLTLQVGLIAPIMFVGVA